MPEQHATGHVKLIERKRGLKFYAKCRVNGREITRLIGPAWLKRTRPPAGHFTRSMAEARLEEILVAAAAAPAAGAHTFGEACAEWLRWGEQERGWAERTVQKNHGAVRARLFPFFGTDTPLAEITTEMVDDFRRHELTEGGARGRALSRTSVQGDMTHLSGIFLRAHKKGWIDSNPYTDAEKVEWKPSGDFDALEVHEVEALARAAKTEQEAALYRVAAFAGLRFGELRALRWRFVEFATANIHVRRNFPVHATREKLPKGKQVRSVPMFDQVARELDGLSRRGYLTRPEDLVFVGAAGGHLGYGYVKDALYEALEAAGLGRIRFHDLRHSYGTMAVRIYDLPKVQLYMGHERVETTMRYVHSKSKTEDAALGSAFIEAQMKPYPEPYPEPATSRRTERNSPHLRAA